MRHTDIAIVGGGLAGSTAAAMLGRAGISAILIDPHRHHPPDFRSEKLAAPQVRILHKTGLAGPVQRATTPVGELLIARFGRLVEKRPSGQLGFAYDTLVNAVRAEIPEAVELIHAKAAAISASADRQSIRLSSGEDISARLVVLATGLNNGLRRALGVAREDLSACHSTTIGFDVRPADRLSFDFRALTYFPERIAERIAYLSLFPIGPTMRANLFCYRDMRDPWLRDFRAAPGEALLAAMPGLARITGACEITGEIKIRPVDLCITSGHRQPGLVLVGDAFATSCPAAGTGVSKVLTDVERLCNVHIPGWLASPGMGAEKIAAFYDDPVKQACDAHSATLAWHVRSMALDPSWPWRVRRFGKLAAQLAVGHLRHAAERLSKRPPGRPRAAAGSGAGP